VVNDDVAPFEMTGPKMKPKPVFVDLSRRPGIGYQPGGPVRQLYFSYRPARLHRLATSIPRNRFPGSINVYKYGLRGLSDNLISIAGHRMEDFCW
jgi:hypothetical protein